MQVLEALDRFIVQLQANGRSKHTISQYRRHVRLFASWWSDKPVEEVDDQSLAIFLAGPLTTIRPDGKPKRATSVNALRTSMRVFFSYLHGAGVTASNPARLIQHARCGSPPPRGLSREQQDRLLEALRTEDGARDYALFHTLLATGIRVGSAVALRVEDVDTERAELSVRTKGDQREKVVLGPKIQEHLRRYIAGLTQGPLFPVPSGKAIGVRQVNRRLRHWLSRAEIERSASAHSLRHTFAMRLYERTSDLGVVRRALCHRSIASTVVYARASDAVLRKALAQ